MEWVSDKVSYREASLKKNTFKSSRDSTTSFLTLSKIPKVQNIRCTGTGSYQHFKFNRQIEKQNFGFQILGQITEGGGEDIIKYRFLSEWSCVNYKVTSWCSACSSFDRITQRIEAFFINIRFAGYPAGYLKIGYPAFWYPVSGRIPDSWKWPDFAGYRILNRISGPSLVSTQYPYLSIIWCL